MRILHVISTLAPAAGGPTAVIHGLATAQADAGHNVTVCTTDCNHPAKTKLPADYFEAFYPSDVTLKVFSVEYAPLLLSFSMAKWLAANVNHFDIVHIHGLYRFPPMYAAYQARKKCVPFVICPHGSLDPYLYDKSAHSVWLKRLFERLFVLPNLNRASGIHYTTDDERKRVSFLALQAPWFVVPNGLDWERYRVMPDRGAFRSDIGIGSAPMILFLGRIHFKKGLDLLIPAFELVRRIKPEAKLVIVGPENDEYGERVRGWVRDSGLEDAVHFVGALHRDDVVQAYVDADVFALPSYTENFGMTVVEAMACALPVVISDQVNICAEVARVRGGLVVRCDVQELAGALEALLCDADSRKAMGASGRRFVEDTYTWPKIVGALANEYKARIGID